MKRALIAFTPLLLLAACGEAPQTSGGARQDAAAYIGTGTAFDRPGWKPGEKTSWESQLRARGQQGQNEYNKTQTQ